ncbi:hypothetical protein BGX28_006239, partial [Mortierella sp. GBA30]
MQKIRSFSEKQHERWYKDNGWHFNEDNDFVDKNGNLFDFGKQQEHYDFVHAKIKEHVYAVLIKQYKFVKYPIPEKKTLPQRKDCPHVFMTPDVMFNPNLLVIVQGMGEVPPGQWARKLFTNGAKSQWEYATQIPYIERAMHLGWAVILCDPFGCKMCDVSSEFKKRVKAIALLDGIDGRAFHKLNDGQWLKEHSWSFRKSDGREPQNGETVATEDHDSVPGTAVGQVFEYLEECHNLFEASLPAEEFK